MQRDTESLVDQIYEAAAFPELWPEALDGLSRHIGAMGGIIGTRSRDDWFGATASNALRPDLFAQFSGSPRAQESLATVRVMEQDRAGFVTSQEVFAAGEWEKDPLYTDWIAPNGGGGAAIATAIQAPSGEFVIVHFHRRKGERLFSLSDRNFLDGFRPHLARAGLLAARWRLERLRAAAEALALIGLPALVVNAQGRVLAANALIEPMAALIRWLPRDQIALTDAGADGLLRQALAELSHSQSTSVSSFACRAAVDECPSVVHVVPTPGMARDLFDGAIAVVVVTPVSGPAPPSQTLIRGLFDLTPSEARAAQGIAKGLTIEEMAQKQSVSHETVRTHVKAVLAKTGTRRQSEVAALLGSIPTFPISRSDT